MRRYRGVCKLAYLWVDLCTIFVCVASSISLLQTISPTFGLLAYFSKVLRDRERQWTEFKKNCELGAKYQFSSLWIWLLEDVSKIPSDTLYENIKMGWEGILWNKQEHFLVPYLWRTCWTVQRNLKRLCTYIIFTPKNLPSSGRSLCGCHDSHGDELFMKSIKAPNPTILDQINVDPRVHETLWKSWRYRNSKH